ncbi:hypothetical protein FACS1894201_07490 [Bacteroidia bacterium]|nr:hypothetical protein FACS1894201_07490 [Bacteroidia bacterium]
MNNITRTFLIYAGFFLLSAGIIAAQDSPQQQKDAYRKQITETDGEEKLKLYSFLTGIYYVEAADEILRETRLIASLQNNEERCAFLQKSNIRRFP